MSLLTVQALSPAKALFPNDNNSCCLVLHSKFSTVMPSLPHKSTEEKVYVYTFCTLPSRSVYLRQIKIYVT